MSDEINKNPLPRVIKGTGFYTPIDMAPAPAPSPAPTPAPVAPTEVAEMTGFPSTLHIEPAPAPQPSEGDTNGQSN